MSKDKIIKKPNKFPVLATRVGDNEYHIKDGKNGFLCEAIVDSITQKIGQILKSLRFAEVVKYGYN